METRRELNTQAPIRPSPVAHFTEAATICNINPAPVNPLNRTHGIYFINIPAERGKYALTPIAWTTGYMERGEMDMHDPTSRSEYLIGAREIAEDLCREINTGIPGAVDNFWGCFICADSDGPNARELADARARLEKVMISLVNMGDLEWARYHKFEFIGDHSRYAASYLGVTKEWAYDQNRLAAEAASKAATVVRATCPACGSPLPVATAAVCATCHAILDEKKAFKFGLIPSASASRTRAQKGASE